MGSTSTGSWRCQNRDREQPAPATPVPHQCRPVLNSNIAQLALLQRLVGDGATVVLGDTRQLQQPLVLLGLRCGGICVRWGEGPDAGAGRGPGGGVEYRWGCKVGCQGKHWCPCAIRVPAWLSHAQVVRPATPLPSWVAATTNPHTTSPHSPAARARTWLSTPRPFAPALRRRSSSSSSSGGCSSQASTASRWKFCSTDKLGLGVKQ